MNFILPEKIKSIISILNNAGFSAHIVGGCVRDLIIGKTPHDWDITTSALPAQVGKIFQICHQTGLRHGTVTINHDGQVCEITTWRKEKVYADHRRPVGVEFTASLTEDLARRDFTMNAIAYNPSQGLIDPFNGINDIYSGIIRAVGNPDLRFEEDALRMLRAIRFSAQLGFKLETDTFIAIRKHEKDICYISYERIQYELNRILASPHPSKLSLIWEAGLNQTIFPGISSLPHEWIRAAEALKDKFSPVPLLLAMLFYHSFDSDRISHAKYNLRNLKYSNAILKNVCDIINACEIINTRSERNMRRAFHEYGNEAYTQALSLLDLQTESNEKARSSMNEPVHHGHSINIQKLELNAYDIQTIGITDRLTGLMLSVLRLCIFENPLLNEKEILLLIARAINSKFQ